MNFTAEQMKKINEAKTEEELIALAKAEGIEMSEEEIKAKFAEMHKEGEIADDELNNVAGGCGEHEIVTHTMCENARCSKYGSGSILQGDHREIIRCPECGREMNIMVYDNTDNVELYRNF